MAKSKLSALEQPQAEYDGIIKLENRVVIFEGNTVPLMNVAQVMNRVIPAKIRINMLLLVLLSLVVIAFAAVAVIERELLYLIGAGASLCVFSYGVWERQQRPSYGLIIELVSGTCYYFVSREEVFIQGTYTAFANAIQKGLDFVANFQNLHYTIMKGKYVNVKGSTIIDGDNMGPVNGGNYTEQIQPHATSEAVQLTDTLRHIVEAQQHPEAEKFWTAFTNELHTEQPDSLKLTLLFDKVVSLIGTDKIAALLQQQVAQLIKDTTTAQQ